MASGREPIEALALLAHVEKLVDEKVADYVAGHERESERRWSQYMARLDDLEKLIRSGFPGGDPPGHCRVHESYIVEAGERRELIKQAKGKAIDLTVGGLLIVLGVALWDYIKAQVTK